ncbi:MAG: hypothetical protein GY866_09835, partial [Proteobacteria bacterium]|nr:hypothetical protein [Pseudomonadota bacterium]
PDFGILERETIVEVGNVLINSVACSISDMLEVETSYEMPEIAIANRTISVEEESEDNIYCLGQGKFSVEGIEIHGNLMLILTYNRLEHIIAKLSYS